MMNDRHYNNDDEGKKINKLNYNMFCCVNVCVLYVCCVVVVLRCFNIIIIICVCVCV